MTLKASDLPKILILPGDLALASFEKLTNQKYSNAPLCPDMFHNEFITLSQRNQLTSLVESDIRKRCGAGHALASQHIHES